MHINRHFSLLVASCLVQYTCAQNATSQAAGRGIASPDAGDACGLRNISSSDPIPYPFNYGPYNILITPSPIGPKVPQPQMREFLSNSLNKFRDEEDFKLMTIDSPYPNNYYVNLAPKSDSMNTNLNVSLIGGPSHELLVLDVKAYLETLGDYVNICGSNVSIPSLTIIMYHFMTHQIRGLGVLDTRDPSVIATSHNSNYTVADPL